jgi:hypothetical protein
MDLVYVRFGQAEKERALVPENGVIPTISNEAGELKE